MHLLLIGLGSMGKRRARLCKGIDAAIKITGVDTAESRRAEAQSLGLIDAAFASLPAALAAGGAESCDAALVCTAPLAHAALIGQLLDAGLPVFTELNLVADGYEENIAKAKERGLPLFLSSTMLYRRETQYIKQKAAAYGKSMQYIYHIGQYLPDWHPWENYKDFFVGEARTGGVREILGIDLPWLLDAFGPWQQVSCEVHTVSALGLPYPDTAILLLRHQNGTQGVLVADVVSPKAVRNFECFGDGVHLFWEGNPKALYEFRDGDKRFVDTYGSFEHDPRYSDNIVENAYVDELLNFFGVLRGEQTPRWSFEKDLRAIELMDAVQHTGERAQQPADPTVIGGATVTVPIITEEKEPGHDNA